MGLLEKAQKKQIDKTRDIDYTSTINQNKDQQNNLKEQTNKKIEEKLTSTLDENKEEKGKTGLLAKIKQIDNQIIEKQEVEQEGIEEKTTENKDEIAVPHKIKEKKGEEKEIIEERKGFGWNGMGSRRIVYDHNIDEYVYEVSEPVLDKNELELKKELSHLFKMLSDKDISEMESEDKKKYLEETLEQIIIDNDIKFYIKEKNESPKKTLKEFFGFKSKKINEHIISENNIETKKDEPKKSFKNLFSKKEKNYDNEKKDEIHKKEPKIKKTKEEIQEEKKEMEIIAKKTKEKIFYHLFREFLGYGPIDILMEDDGIEDISCDGHHVPIFLYHKKYEGISTNIWFEGKEELDSFVIRLSQICGKQISIYSPIVDGKLPDGSRLQTTLARTVTKPSTFTIRRFRENPLTPIDLIEFKSLSIEMAAYFWMAIEKGASILLCGGTASGKTTALNALSLFIPASYKIITIEDTREISLPHKNWIAGTTRQGFSSSEDNKTGKDIDMFDLIRAALRQRPKVVMVGEVRGREAYSLFQAMATGHTSYATVHASTIHTLIQRLENPPISLPRALLTSLDIIVFQNAVDISGKTVRRMTSVTEVIKLDPDTNQLIFMEPFQWVSKTDDRFESGQSSKVLNNIRLQNDWNEDQLDKELENRKMVLEWMGQKNIRDYMEVGKIVSEYQKHPKALLERIQKEIKH